VAHREARVKKAKKIPTWLALGVLGAGMIPLAVLGLYTYTTATAPVLHPDPEGVSSVTRPAPTAAWEGAVEQARRIARAGLAEQNLPGLSVAVGAGADLVWAEGFGWADLENRVEVEPETRFRIGTASQVLTSAGVGLLLDSGRLKLDETIQAYVPEFPVKQWPVTVRQLMAHMAGVRNDAGDEEPVTVRCERTLDVLPRFAGNPLRFDPGTQYRQSSYGWMLVSAAVEAAAGEPFFSFMRSQVFEPMGMNDTRADSGIESSAKRAVSYFPRFAADPRYGPQDPNEEEDYSCFSGAGAFLSTPSDLVRFGLAVNDGKFLQPATVRLLQTSQRVAAGQETGYGLGWDLEIVTLAGQQTTTVGHDGDLRGGGVSTFITLPDRGLVVAVISNTSYADTSSVATGIAQAFVEHLSATRR
jgi:serine beta-lactamase-like protein LACTB